MAQTKKDQVKGSSPAVDQNPANDEKTPQIPSAGPEWPGNRVFVAFPAYKYTNPATAWCLMAMGLDFGLEKIRPHMEFGDAMIYHTRNVLAHHFLQSEAEYLFFLDDDIVCPIGRPQWFKEVCRLPDDYPDEAAGLNTLLRLVYHKQGLVGATYFERNAKGLPVNSLRTDENYHNQIRRFHDKAIPCNWVGTGCMLIHRQVFLDIQAKFPELEGEYEDRPFNFFQPENGIGGEDISFCHRAEASGHQPHVDAALQPMHVGLCAFGQHNTGMRR